MRSNGNRYVFRAGLASVMALLLGFAATVRAQEELMQDVGASYQVVLPYAEKGDAAAQFILGTMLAKTRDRNRNIPEALKWFEKSALQGFAKAQYMLAEVYFAGKDVPENYQEAVKWYQAAARQELAKAELAMGNLYKDGVAVPKNLVHAAHWFGRAARQAEAEAQLNMGQLCAAGLANLPQDKVEAYKWYVLAASNNQTDAIDLRDNLRAQMTREQIAEAQNRAAALAATRPRLSPRLEQQDAEIKAKVKLFESILAGGATP